MNDYLCHFGIKGMRWGVRRTDAQLGHDTASGSPGMGGATKSTQSPTANVRKKSANSAGPKVNKKALLIAGVAATALAGLAVHKVLKSRSQSMERGRKLCDKFYNENSESMHRWNDKVFRSVSNPQQQEALMRLKNHRFNG